MSSNGTDGKYDLCVMICNTLYYKNNERSIVSVYSRFYDPKKMNDGCFIIDLHFVDKHPERIRLLYKAPEVQMIEDRYSFDIKDGFKGYCPKEFGSFEYATKSQYIEYWRKRGARIGQYINGKVVWHHKLQPRQEILF